MTSFMKIGLIFLLLAAAMLFGRYYERVEQIAGPKIKVSKTLRTIGPAKLSEVLAKEDVVLINVHTPYEGEIAKTDLFIPFDEMVANQGKLPQDKNTKIILYCKSGTMSKQAFATLADLGYKNLYHLDGGMDKWKGEGFALLDLSSLPGEVLPTEGVTLSIKWGQIGPRLVKLGVIDTQKFEKAVKLTDAQRKILLEGDNEKIVINSKNSQFVVDVLWALGLAQKSLVYEQGPMGTQYKDKAGNFASTGGWTLASGNAMDHYNRHSLMNLTAEQEKRVGDIAKNIFRPCCNNPTWFPDCNHGMAALAAVELMVAGNLSDEQIYKEVLALNSFWFPTQYLTVATYFARNGTQWQNVDSKKVLGAEYSSSTGFNKTAKEVGDLPFNSGSGGGCGA